MPTYRRQQAILRQRQLGHVEMKTTGDWGLTRAGRDFLDDLDLLRELDDRPWAARDRVPDADTTSGSAAGGTRSGDDDRQRRQRNGKGRR